MFSCSGNEEGREGKKGETYRSVLEATFSLAVSKCPVDPVCKSYCLLPDWRVIW